MENKWSGGLDLNMPQNDERDFKLDVLGAWFGSYTPKYTKVILKTLSTKNQGPQNTCVCESGAQQKEVDEGVLLSPQSIACYLNSKGVMNETGTSLIEYQKATVSFGMAEESLMDNYHNTSFQTFADPKKLTDQIKENAAKHKAGSYWRTDTLETVLKQIDLAKDGQLKNGIGQTGALWYSGYNPSVLSAPYVLTMMSGQFVGGHAFNIVGYDLNYHGLKVLALKTTFGEGIYDDTIFYVSFEDFSKLCKYGVYYTLDIPRNVAEWLAKNAHKAILEKDGPKVWIIEDNKKRYVPDEALMWMLDITPSELVRDSENYLVELETGEPMSIADIPLQRQEDIKYFVQMSRDNAFMKDRFIRYFGDLWK